MAQCADVRRPLFYRRQEVKDRAIVPYVHTGRVEGDGRDIRHLSAHSSGSRTES